MRQKEKFAQDLVMKATVRFRIFGHLMSAAIVKALPNTPITIMKIVMTPEKRLSPKEDLQTKRKISSHFVYTRREIQRDGTIEAIWQSATTAYTRESNEKGNLFIHRKVLHTTYVHERAHKRERKPQSNDHTCEH